MAKKKAANKKHIISYELTKSTGMGDIITNYLNDLFDDWANRSNKIISDFMDSEKLKHEQFRSEHRQHMNQVEIYLKRMNEILEKKL